VKKAVGESPLGVLSPTLTPSGGAHERRAPGVRAAGSQIVTSIDAERRIRWCSPTRHPQNLDKPSLILVLGCVHCERGQYDNDLILVRVYAALPQAALSRAEAAPDAGESGGPGVRLRKG
jgi:hypothetical protein